MNNDYVFSPRARIACFSGDEQSFEALTTSFERAGFDVAKPDAGKPADLGLIDLRKRPVPARKAKTIASVLRRKSPESPLVFLVDPALDAPAKAALKRFGEIIPAHNDVDHALVRCKEILRLRNIAEETGERLKSLATLNRLVEFPLIATSEARARVLIAGAPDPAAIAAVNAVGAIAEDCICVLTAGQAMRALEYGEFDCAIFLPTPENDPMLAFIRTLRRHPRHAHMAVIQIADHSVDLSNYARKGARDFILSEQISTELGPKAQVVSRRARLLRSMSTFLRSCRGDNIRDASSGAFTSAFLSEHGARLCGRADQTGRPLSLGLVRLNPERGAGTGAQRNALVQAARMINRITRAEDLVARISADKFVVLTAATQVDDAINAARRIEGVLSNTAFRNGKDAPPFSVGVTTEFVARAPGASIEETVALAMRRLDHASSAKAQK